MKRKIDIGEDKNLFVPKTAAQNKPQSKFMMDDLAKTAEEAMNDARKLAWPNWVNSEPLILGHVDNEDGRAHLFYISDDVRKRVVLLDIWDYTLPPCRRSLSYVLEWYKRYNSAGLVIIGVHAPMFKFAHDKKNIMDACRSLGIEYPVVMDNYFDIWRAVENRFWPRRILIDSKGKIQQDVAGEGAYDVFEKSIQELLRELSPGLACPPILKPLRKIDLPDYQIPQTTDDIFFGLGKGTKLGNTQKLIPNEEIDFTDESGGTYAPDLPYFEGGWMVTSESMHGSPAYRKALKITLNFKGTDAYIVAASKAKAAGDIPQFVRLTVTLDRKPVTPEHLGADALLNEYRKTIVTVRDPRLYHIIKGEDHKSHELVIEVPPSTTDTLELYAIFFEHTAK